MTKERVVITGIGVISAVGSGKDAFWDGIVNGRSGVKRVTKVPEKLQATCKIAAEITDFDVTKYMDPKQARRADRFIQYAIAASKLAAEDAKLDMTKENPEKVPSFFAARKQRLASATVSRNRLARCRSPSLAVAHGRSLSQVLARGSATAEVVDACRTSRKAPPVAAEEALPRRGGPKAKPRWRYVAGNPP